MANVAPLTPYRTYTLAHTAKCKLNLAANRPDRNLRFVLGHAVLLDNVLVRIVEIENQSAKQAFENKNKNAGGDFDCTATNTHGSSPLKQSSTANTTTEPSNNNNGAGGRRVSFQDNNARPNLSVDAAQGTKSPRSKSPPPPPSKKDLKSGHDSEDTSSDDYDFDDPSNNLYENENEDEDEGLGLTRFASASAQQPRQAPPPQQPPPLSSSDSDEEEEDESGIEPISPPALPENIDLTQILSGPEDTELSDLYESVRRCPCHGHHKDEDCGYSETGEKGKMWSLPPSADQNSDKAKKNQLAVMKVGAGTGPKPVSVAA